MKQIIQIQLDEQCCKILGRHFLLH